MERKFDSSAFHPLLRGEEKLTMTMIDALDDEHYEEVLRVVIDYEQDHSIVLHGLMTVANDRKIKIKDKNYFDYPEIVAEYREKLKERRDKYLATCCYKEHWRCCALLAVLDQMIMEHSLWDTSLLTNK